MMLRRRMMMAQGEATLAYGCYIQDTTGKLWKAGTWDGSATFNGVAVYTEECAFVMRQGAYNKPMMSLTSNVSSSLIEYPTEQEAKADFNGVGNTGLLPSSSSAKIYVEENPFPDGDVGYIPSLGELWKAYEYKNEVNALFIEATGGAFTDTIYGSSTLESGSGGKGRSAYFWTLDFGTGAVTSVLSTSTSPYIRPFKELWIPDVMPKRENKIICEYYGLSSGTGLTSYNHTLRSEYPVYSDVVVEWEYEHTSFGSINGTTTIAKGSASIIINTLSKTSPTILSVTPTEDDKYIYVF